MELFKKYILLAILLLIAIAGVAAGGYYYMQYKNAQNLLKNPNLQVNKETGQLVAQVGKLMVLPTDEQPTVATVTDASKLKDQAFFKNAKNGYKVLIYVKARKAILFDPVKDVIIDVAPVNIAQSQVTPVPSGAPTAAPTAQQQFVPQTSPVPTK